MLLGVVLVTVTEGRPPAVDCFGFSAAALVPTVAWLCRAALTADPPGSRAVISAAAGTGQAHLGCLLSALVATIAFTAVATVVVTVLVLAEGAPDALGARLSTTGLAAVVGAGFVTQLACALVGTGIGFACNPPLIGRLAPAASAAVVGVLVALVSSASPANAAIRGLGGTQAELAVHAGWLPLLTALGLVVCTGAGSTWIAVRRGPG
jgi:hypothetical protein